MSVFRIWHTKNKRSCSELWHDELVENSKYESYRVIFKQEEEENLGEEDMIEKIDEEHELELIAERYEEDCDNEL